MNTGESPPHFGVCAIESVPCVDDGASGMYSLCGRTSARVRLALSCVRMAVGENTGTLLAGPRLTLELRERS